MSTVKIKSAKLVDDNFLEVQVDESMSAKEKKKQKIDSTVPVHDDLKSAFSRLHRHLAILCDIEKTPKAKDFQHISFDKFVAKGFSIGGKEENEGVVVSGYMLGKFGSVTLNTPFKRFGDSDDYGFISELKDDVDTCITEVNEYLFNDKRAPEAQLKLELPNGDNGEDLDDQMDGE